MFTFHFTKDGEYVDAVGVIPPDDGDIIKMGAIADMLEGCQGWCRNSQGNWYTIAASGLRFARWEPVMTSIVPKCVQVAEMVV